MQCSDAGAWSPKRKARLQLVFFSLWRGAKLICEFRRLVPNRSHGDEGDGGHEDDEGREGDEGREVLECDEGCGVLEGDECVEGHEVLECRGVLEGREEDEADGEF